MSTNDPNPTPARVPQLTPRAIILSVILAVILAAANAYLGLFAGLGGLLGVLFSVPLRRTMIVEEPLPFPEGKAAAEVLKAGENPGPGFSPAFSTSAAALPSGNGSGSSTIMVRRKGTENSTPRRPPRPAIASTQEYSKLSQ